MVPAASPSAGDVLRHHRHLGRGAGMAELAARTPLEFHKAVAVTPLLIQVMPHYARERSCLSLPCLATRARVLPRQEEVAAQSAA
jgi:hypothetical protein